MYFISTLLIQTLQLFQSNFTTTYLVLINFILLFSIRPFSFFISIPHHLIKIYRSSVDALIFWSQNKGEQEVPKYCLVFTIFLQLKRKQNHHCWFSVSSNIIYLWYCNQLVKLGIKPITFVLGGWYFELSAAIILLDFLHQQVLIMKQYYSI